MVEMSLNSFYLYRETMYKSCILFLFYVEKQCIQDASLVSALSLSVIWLDSVMVTFIMKSHTLTFVYW